MCLPVGVLAALNLPAARGSGTETPVPAYRRALSEDTTYNGQYAGWMKKEYTENLCPDSTAA
jgi:hypothetical protein